MRHEETEFVGGPLDGRVLEVMVGLTGQPPKVYPVPVPQPDGSERVYVYVRTPAKEVRPARRARWVFVYEPEGRPASGPKWPWSKRT
ncbi:hypothetical protein [Streptomyces sp. HPF1205]|uniref:hypothetical protein n=1 Tax=Streptomyces sp. HPF1205 TaxID=2873262 RepID=UPI001CED82FC|nr:hypothetical protein [Streptomyces sp. HPF1205]